MHVLAICTCMYTGWFYFLQRPLMFSNPTVFQRVTKFGFDIRHHVIPLVEYIVGNVCNSTLTVCCTYLYNSHG